MATFSDKLAHIWKTCGDGTTNRDEFRKTFKKHITKYSKKSWWPEKKDTRAVAKLFDIQSQAAAAKSKSCGRKQEQSTSCIGKKIQSKKYKKATDASFWHHYLMKELTAIEKSGSARPPPRLPANHPNAAAVAPLMTFNGKVILDGEVTEERDVKGGESSLPVAQAPAVPGEVSDVVQMSKDILHEIKSTRAKLRQEVKEAQYNLEQLRLSKNTMQPEELRYVPVVEAESEEKIKSLKHQLAAQEHKLQKFTAYAGKTEPRVKVNIEKDKGIRAEPVVIEGVMRKLGVGADECDFVEGQEADSEERGRGSVRESRDQTEFDFMDGKPTVSSFVTPKVSRTRYHLRSHDKADTDEHDHEDNQIDLMMPLVQVPGGGPAVFRPWKFGDMDVLLRQLPNLREGAAQWLRAVESNTLGVRLALGDIRALIGKTATAYTVRKIDEEAKTTLLPDETPFGPYRQIWGDLLRAEFPMDWGPEASSTFFHQPGQAAEDYMHKAITTWVDRTGTHPSANGGAASAIFKQAVMSGLPEQVQAKCGDVPGLSTDPWARWRLTICHFLQQHVRKQNKTEQQNKDVAVAVMKSQLPTKTKNESPSTVMVTAPPPAWQAPSGTAPGPYGPYPNFNPAPWPTQPPQPYPNYNYPKPGGRGRVRGGASRGRGRGGAGGQYDACYHCGQPGHWARDCPNRQPEQTFLAPGPAPYARGPPPPPQAQWGELNNTLAPQFPTRMHQ